MSLRRSPRSFRARPRSRERPPSHGLSRRSPPLTDWRLCMVGCLAGQRMVALREHRPYLCGCRPWSGQGVVGRSQT